MPMTSSGSRPGLFGRIGRFSYRQRRWVIAAWVVLILAALPLLPSIHTVLRVGGFSSDDTEGARARAMLERELGFSPSSMAVIYQSDTLEPSSIEFLDQVEASLANVGSLEFVTDVLTPRDDPSLIAPSGRLAYAVVGLNIGPEEAQRDVPEFEAAIVKQPDLDIVIAGAPSFYRDIEIASQRDLRRAEFIAFPFALIALLVVFGTAVAAAVPLVVGGAGVAVIMLLIFGAAHLFDMSIFALNLASMLGLGLAVDYSLFVTSRFREEQQQHPGDTEAAVIVATQTAGRSVVFSGLTVLIGLFGLTLFPIMFLRSIGIAGVIVVIVSTTAAVTLLPAILGFVAPHLERFPALPRRWRRIGGVQHHGFWRGVASISMARPIVIAACAIAVLVTLGLPFLRANISSPDATLLPTDLPSRQGYDLLSAEYSGGEISPFVIAMESPTLISSSDNIRAIQAVIEILERDPRIGKVQSALTIPGQETSRRNLILRIAAEYFGTDTRLSSFINPKVTMILAYPRAQANSAANKDLLHTLRDIEPGGDLTMLVAGGTAEIVDVVDEIYEDFPLAATLVVAATYVVLLILFRSVLLPIKAILMNALSILASYGALVWIFQEGHLHKYLGFSPQGYVEASLPVIMFCVLFGLSMDYEVFLLTRIREEWDKSGNNEQSVVTGLERSGRIITSAALIVVVVTGSFVVADVVLIKALGVGIALAVALDATVIRAFLVPATMKVFGSWNWWVPEWLDRILLRISPSEH
jgi:RND superfamily putative drug exporter